MRCQGTPWERSSAGARHKAPLVSVEPCSSDSAGHRHHSQPRRVVVGASPPLPSSGSLQPKGARAGLRAACPTGTGISPHPQPW